MFKPRRIIFIALQPLLLYGLLVFLKTSSQSLPQAKLFAEGVINADADEYGPAFTPDGKRIFFASLRPLDGVEPKNRRDFNIWLDEKTAGGWSEPKHVGPAVNSPAYEYYPSVAAKGTLYFAFAREGGKGSADLYRARLVNGKYEQV